MSAPNPRFLVICPTARDRSHLARPEIRGDYQLEFRGTDEETHEPGFDAVRFLTGIAQELQARHGEFDGIVGIDDFPASMLATLLAERFGFAAPSFEALFLCHHKYYSRLRQLEAAPEATPQFRLLPSSRPPLLSEISLPFPIFVKPVKSYLSILARRADRFDQVLAAAAEAPRRLGTVASMFDTLVGISGLNGRYRHIPALSLLVEDLLTGFQVTLDGYACRNEIVLLGVVDSFLLPGSLSFERFTYPSRLPSHVQERMGDVAQRVIRHIGLNQSFFNVEFFYRPEDDSIWLIEVNGRLSSQFAPLYRMVDGIDTYAMQLDILLGRDPGGKELWAPGRTTERVAASFVLRRFADDRVMRIPSEEDLQRFAERFPEAFVEVLVKEGERLSEELQDDESYRYALVDLCADSWTALEQRFEEAKLLLPFTFLP